MINGRMNPIQFIFYSDKLKEFKEWKESRIMSVDGVIPVGINLSHWPGNRTPERFKAKTTTEMVMKLNGARDRADILEGVEVVTNNHYDTDGFLSVLGVFEPDFVDKHKEDLMDAAESGDFQRYTSDIGLKLDLLLANYSSSEKSPFYEGFGFGKFGKEGEGGVWEVKKRQKMYEDLLRDFKGMVGGLGEYEFLYGEDYRLTLEELSDVVSGSGGVRKEEYSDLGLSIFFGGYGKNGEKYREFVVNSWCEGERILEVMELGGGQYRYELRYTVDSWFDLGGVVKYERKGFRELCEELNDVEGRKEGLGWNYDAVGVPIPRLRQAKSRLKPGEVIGKILRFFG